MHEAYVVHLRCRLEIRAVPRRQIPQRVVKKEGGTQLIATDYPASQLLFAKEGSKLLGSHILTDRISTLSATVICSLYDVQPCLGRDHLFRVAPGNNTIVGVSQLFPGNKAEGWLTSDLEQERHARDWRSFRCVT